MLQLFNIETEKIFLELEWHKTENEAYCRSATLILPISYVPNIVRIEVKYVRHTFENKKIASTTRYRVYKYLENIKEISNGVAVLINYEDILQAICLDEWISGKKGKGKIRKAYPTEILVDCGNDVYTCILNDLGNTTPFDACRDGVEKMSTGDKIHFKIGLIYG